MQNPFAQFAPRNGPAPLEEEYQAPTPEASVVNTNEFAQFAERDDAESSMDTWSTQVRNKWITFQAPRGATKAQIRTAAKEAGVPDPQNRSLLYGDKTGEKTLAQKEAGGGKLEAAIHHGVDFVMPFVDEIAASTNSILTGSDYTDNMRRLEMRSEELYDENPWSSNFGRVAGVLGTLPIAIGTKALQGANWLGTSLRTAAAGAPLGAVNAYGSNPVDDRWNGVPLASFIGAGAGAVAPAVANVGSALARRVDQRLGISDFARRTFGRATPEVSGEQAAVDVIAARTKQAPDEMRRRVEEFRAAGQEPTLVNAMDETGRGLVGAMARRPGPGREVAQRAYDERRLSAPERIDRNMADALERSTEGAPARTAVSAEMRRPVDDVLSDLTETRSAEIEAAMSPIRANPVPLSPRMAEIIDTADGRRAVARAMRTVSDPETLAVMRNLPALAKQMRQLDPRLPPAARQQIMDQLLEGQGLTVDVADRIARKFNAMADSADADVQRVLRGFARDFRDEARVASPEYAAALEKYATTSRSIEAVKLGQEFLTPNSADEFAKHAAALNEEIKISSRTPSASMKGKFSANSSAGMGPEGGSEHNFTYVSEAGEKIEGTIYQLPDDPKAMIEIYGTGGDSADANRVGAAAMRDLGRHIAVKFPDIKEVFGPRYGGSRVLAGREGVEVGVSLENLRRPVNTYAPSDRQRAMQGARRSVQRAAGENISNAPGVARRIAVSPEQHARNTALFGPVNAEKLEQAMAITERNLRDFAQVAPNTGSATAIRGQDDEAAAGMLQAAASIKTGNWAQGALALLRSIGIRDQDAGRIVELAVDPARVDDLITMLERSYGRETAQKIGRVIALPSVIASSRGVGGSR